MQSKTRKPEDIARLAREACRILAVKRITEPDNEQIFEACKQAYFAEARADGFHHPMGWGDWADLKNTVYGKVRRY
jgi:hypothetical protein